MNLLIHGLLLTISSSLYAALSKIIIVVYYNSLIQDLFEFIGAPKDTVYIGKITNSYPNCYMISKDNNESLDGCLICITTGLTDNSYAFSEYLSLLRFIDIERLQENQYIDYLNILTFDIVNRIKNKYGDEFATSDLVQIADLTINEYWFQDFQIMASNISYCIDFFAVLHEYVHYLINSFSNNKNSYISKLIIQTVSLYAKFCEINPKIKHLLPQNEVVADLGALLILHDFFQFNEEMVCSVILAVKQLERMSSQDDYTNHYRTKIVEFFLNELNISQTPVVKNRISRIYNLFILADDSEVQLSKMKKLAYESIIKLINKNGLSNSVLVYFKERAKLLVELFYEIENSEGIDEDEFEEF